MSNAIDRRLASGLTATLLLAVFAYFIHEPMPLRVISFLCLIATSWLIASQWDKEMIIGKALSKKRFLISMITMLSMAVGIAVYLRNNSGLPALPVNFSPFAWIAVMIGCGEELVFRGWMQSSIRGRISGIVIPAFAHALYKASLFLSPSALYEVDALSLFNVTLIAGVLLSLSRRISGSVWPAVLAHGMFDLIAYGDAALPWWVM